MTTRNIDADLLLGVILFPDVVVLCPRFDVDAALEVTILIEGQSQQWFVMDHPRGRHFEEPLERGRHAEDGGDKLIVVALISEIETKEDVNRFAIEGTQ